MTSPSARPRLAVVALAASAAMPLVVGGPTVDAATDPARASAVVNSLGARLHPVLTEAAAGPNDNLVYSPASIGVALAMASAGASGDTLAEFQAVLGLGDAAVHESMGALAGALAGDDSFTLANSLWVQEGFRIEAPFTATLEDQYHSNLHVADFAGDAPGAVEAINTWVADATAGRIPDLLGEGSLDELTRLVLANAVHLDAQWASPFLAEATSPDDFARGDASPVRVDVMHQTLLADYGGSDGLQTIVLPYTNGYEMVVVLPAEGGLAEFEASLAEAGDLDAVIGAPARAEVLLSLPVWETDARADLVAALQALGLQLAFDRNRCDFSAMSTEEELVIGHVLHEANITVDEAGTEAAAATAVVMEAAGAMPPTSEAQPIVMDVDHPFFFAIRHSETGAVVFQGHVNDPS